MIEVIAALAISLSPADPSPGIQPPGPNGQAPAVVMLPPVCATFMPGCGYSYDPGDGTWHQSG